MVRRRSIVVRLLVVAVIGVLAFTGCSGDGPKQQKSVRHPRATVQPVQQVHGTAGDASIGDPYFPESGNGGYDVAHYDLRIRYDPTSPKVRATTTIDSLARVNLRSFNLDFAGLTIDALTVDGRRASFTRRGSELAIHPWRSIAAGHHFLTRVRYHGVPRTVTDPSESAPSKAGQLGWTRNPNGSVFVASEPIGARTWFPSNDHPADKATFDITVDVPGGIAVASKDCSTAVGALASGSSGSPVQAGTSLIEGKSMKPSASTALPTSCAVAGGLASAGARSAPGAVIASSSSRLMP